MSKKGFSEYWDIMDTPVVVFIVYSLLVLIFPLNNLIGNTLAAIISMAVMILTFGSIGYKSLGEKDIKPAKVGAWAGVFIGFVMALLGIFTFYMYPERIIETIRQAASQGADPGFATNMVKIGTYLNLIILPIFYAAIGALISWVSSLIFKNKVGKKKKNKSTRK